MKITAITTHVINMPLKLDGDVPHVGGQARTALEMVLVRVDTDAGVTGWGEGFGHRIWSATRAAIDKIIAPVCIGRDPTQINTAARAASCLHTRACSGTANSLHWSGTSSRRLRCVRSCATSSWNG